MRDDNNDAFAYATFGKALFGLAEVMGEPMTERRARGYYEVLADIPMAWVLLGIRACANECHFFPKPAEIRERALREDGHPAPEEAWGMLGPLTEEDSVVWTEQMAKAYAVALPLVNVGDLVAARMAFLEAYKRELTTARANGILPRWQASLGYDKAGRQDAIDRAIERNLLTDVARAALPPAGPTLKDAPLEDPEGKKKAKAIADDLMRKMAHDKRLTGHEPPGMP